MDVSNITMGTQLSISVSGTARLQQAAGAPVAATDLQMTADETGAQALSRASAATIEAIEKALEKFSPEASLKGYRDGTEFYNGSGTYFNIIA